MGKGTKGKVGKTIGVVDRDDSIKNKAAEIAEFWAKRTGNNIPFSVPQVMRILINNYHEQLFHTKPSRVDFDRLLEIR